MRFYTQQHSHYCGVDLHARSMQLCVLDQAGEVLPHRDTRAKPDAFLKAVAPYRKDPVVATERMFTWYWLADLCRREDISIPLGERWLSPAITQPRQMFGAGHSFRHRQPQ